MKKLSLVFLLIASFQLAHADNVLKNSDFTDGALNWHGDGRTPADLKPQDSLDAAPDYGDKGLVIPLKSRDWTKIIQEFKTQSSEGTLNITFKLAPNTAFSSKDEDYTNVPHSIGFDAWLPFNGKKGGWMTMVSDFAKMRLFYDTIIPKGGNDPETFSETVSSLIPEDEKTICLAFPPGTGAVILLHVSLDTK
jgi:hypothetical protein